MQFANFFCDFFCGTHFCEGRKPKVNIFFAFFFAAKQHLGPGQLSLCSQVLLLPLGVPPAPAPAYIIMRHAPVCRAEAHSTAARSLSLLGGGGGRGGDESDAMDASPAAVWRLPAQPGRGGRIRCVRWNRLQALRHQTPDTCPCCERAYAFGTLLPATPWTTVPPLSPAPPERQSGWTCRAPLMCNTR